MVLFTHGYVSRAPAPSSVPRESCWAVHLSDSWVVLTHVHVFISLNLKKSPEFQKCHQKISKLKDHKCSFSMFGMVLSKLFIQVGMFVAPNRCGPQRGHRSSKAVLLRAHLASCIWSPEGFLANGSRASFTQEGVRPPQS